LGRKEIKGKRRRQRRKRKGEDGDKGEEYMKSSDTKSSKCHLKFSSRMSIFINLVYLSSVISLQ